MIQFLRIFVLSLSVYTHTCTHMYILLILLVLLLWRTLTNPHPQGLPTCCSYPGKLFNFQLKCHLHRNDFPDLLNVSSLFFKKLNVFSAFSFQLIVQHGLPNGVWFLFAYLSMAVKVFGPCPGQPARSRRHQALSGRNISVWFRCQL